MKKVAVLIDGFNLYHSIKRLQRSLESSEKISFNHLKWVNLHKLSSLFLKKDEQLLDVYYFTAYAYFSDSKTDTPSVRHNTYANFLQASNVKTILGRFKKTTKKCRQCGKHYTTYEEKETDVNISVTAMQLLCDEEVDKLIILSADSDLIPPAKKWLKKGKEISFLIPPSYRYITQEIRKSFSYNQIKRKHLESSLLPESIEFNSKTIYMPDNYKR